jgi:hypothetical protein
VFQQIWMPPHNSHGCTTPLPRAGSAAIDTGTVACTSRAAPPRQASTARCSAAAASSAGVLSTGMARGVHLTRLTQLGHHKSYAMPEAHTELGAPFETSRPPAYRESLARTSAVADPHGSERKTPCRSHEHERYSSNMSTDAFSDGAVA